MKDEKAEKKKKKRRGQMKDVSFHDILQDDSCCKNDDENLDR